MAGLLTRCNIERLVQFGETNGAWRCRAIRNARVHIVQRRGNQSNQCADNALHNFRHV